MTTITLLLIIAFFTLLPFAPVICFCETPYFKDGKKYKGISCHTTLWRGLKLKVRCPGTHIIPAFFG